jgi:hypothetical protein
MEPRRDECVIVMIERLDDGEILDPYISSSSHYEIEAALDRFKLALDFQSQRCQVKST